MDNNKLLNIIIQVIGCNLLDATPISIPVHILVDTDTTIYFEQDLQDWYQGCKRKDVQYRRQDIELLNLLRVDILTVCAEQHVLAATLVPFRALKQLLCAL